MYRKIPATLLGLFLFAPLFSQINHWETAVYADAEWRYMLGTEAPDADWRALGFDETNWSVGNGGIGYGDDDDNTEIPAVPSLFMRQRFEVVDISKIEAAVFHADYDDAFVAYLNGVEIARANINGTPPSWDADAIGWREAEMVTGGLPEPYFMSKQQVAQLLNDGQNVLTVQVHNKDGANSSDMSAIFFLSFGINDDSNDYGQTPDWFDPPGFSSHLPILKINTNGQQIVDNEDIIADFGIIWNEDGDLNNSLGVPDHYAGQIGIELRGSSSLSFPKKNYSIEMKDGAAEDMDTSFLNFPREEDWILHGPYSDKTLMRNVLTMHLARAMGQYASRTRFVELLINESYRGVYVIMEKIKRDEARVDVAKLKETDIAGTEVTGGYIFKVDRGEPAWYSTFNKWNNDSQQLPFVLVYPKLEDIQPQQLDYIQMNVDSFERALMSPTFYYGGQRYDEYIDMNSFAEHFLLSELGKNVDAYRLSSYLHKKKDSDDGKIHAGPIWDFNLAFNNADYNDGWITNGWHFYTSPTEDEPFWWDQLLADEIYRNNLQCRWQELRAGAFHIDSIYQFIDDQVSYLGEAADRNFERWEILDEYVWPNPAVTGSYAGEIENLKNWIAERIQWMDENMFGECLVNAVDDGQNEPLFDVFPNPTDGLVNIRFFDAGNNEMAKVYLADVLGRRVKAFPNGLKTLDISEFPSGVYFVVLEKEGQRFLQKVYR